MEIERIAKIYEKGDVVLQEKPLIALQTLESRNSTLCCSHCLEFIGGWSAQADILLHSNNKDHSVYRNRIAKKNINNGQAFGCIHGFSIQNNNDFQCCSEIYCSSYCQESSANSYHFFECSKADNLKQIRYDADDVDGSDNGMMEFHKHALKTKEIYFAVGRVITTLLAEQWFHHVGAEQPYIFGGVNNDTTTNLTVYDTCDKVEWFKNHFSLSPEIFSIVQQNSDSNKTHNFAQNTQEKEDDQETFESWLLLHSALRNRISNALSTIPVATTKTTDKVADYTALLSYEFYQYVLQALHIHLHSIPSSYNPLPTHMITYLSSNNNRNSDIQHCVSAASPSAELSIPLLSDDNDEERIYLKQFLMRSQSTSFLSTSTSDCNNSSNRAAVAAMLDKLLDNKLLLISELNSSGSTAATTAKYCDNIDIRYPLFPFDSTSKYNANVCMMLLPTCSRRTVHSCLPNVQLAAVIPATATRKSGELPTVELTATRAFSSSNNSIDSCDWKQNDSSSSCSNYRDILCYHSMEPLLLSYVDHMQIDDDEEVVEQHHNSGASSAAAVAKYAYRDRWNQLKERFKIKCEGKSATAAANKDEFLSKILLPVPSSHKLTATSNYYSASPAADGVADVDQQYSCCCQCPRCYFEQIADKQQQLVNNQKAIIATTTTSMKLFGESQLLSPLLLLLRSLSLSQRLSLGHLSMQLANYNDAKLLYSSIVDEITAVTTQDKSNTNNNGDCNSSILNMIEKYLTDSSSNVKAFVDVKQCKLAFINYHSDCSIANHTINCNTSTNNDDNKSKAMLVPKEKLLLLQEQELVKLLGEAYHALGAAYLESMDTNSINSSSRNDAALYTKPISSCEQLHSSSDANSCSSYNSNSNVSCQTTAETSSNTLKQKHRDCDYWCAARFIWQLGAAYCPSDTILGKEVAKMKAYAEVRVNVYSRLLDNNRELNDVYLETDEENLKKAFQAQILDHRRSTSSDENANASNAITETTVTATDNDNMNLVCYQQPYFLGKHFTVDVINNQQDNDDDGDNDAITAMNVIPALVDNNNSGCYDNDSREGKNKNGSLVTSFLHLPVFASLRPITTSKDSHTCSKYNHSSNSNGSGGAVFMTSPINPLISSQECLYVIQSAERHAARSGSGWSTSRHYAVPTTDIPVQLITSPAYNHSHDGATVSSSSSDENISDTATAITTKGVLAWFNSVFVNRLAPLLAIQFQDGNSTISSTTASATSISVAIHDAFVVKYDASNRITAITAADTIIPTAAVNSTSSSSSFDMTTINDNQSHATTSATTTTTSIGKPLHATTSSSSASIDKPLQQKQQQQQQQQTYLPLHCDQSSHSFIIALNSASEYEGGGTYFPAMQCVVRPDIGQVLSFPGGSMLHGGEPITAGTRYILAVFAYLATEVKNADVDNHNITTNHIISNVDFVDDVKYNTQQLECSKVDCEQSSSVLPVTKKARINYCAWNKKISTTNESCEDSTKDEIGVTLNNSNNNSSGSCGGAVNLFAFDLPTPTNTETDDDDECFHLHEEY